jgi:hypothetical protein
MATSPASPATCSNVSRVLRSGGRLVVSHPEGRGFIERLRAAGDWFIESFPKQKEFLEQHGRLDLEVITYRDEPKLYLMVARKM